MKKELTIVVPVYNSEKYLDDCLHSLSKQGFCSNKHEVLIIDDGSIDGSVDIARKYCSQYDYFKLIQKNNGGVSSARNLGISLADSEFIAFVDSDDMVTENSYVNIIEFLKKNNYHSFYFGYSKNIDELDNFNSKFTYKVKREDCCRPSACRYIYSLHSIKDNGILFDETMKYNEDYLFNFTYIELTGTISSGSAQKLYFYRPNQESATGRTKFDENTQNRIREDLIKFALKIKKRFTPTPPTRDLLFEKILSGIIMDYLWMGMIMKCNPVDSINNLKKSGLSNKNIKHRVIESSKLRSFIEYLFKHKIFYRFVCFCYRHLVKNN